jgi:hypothetical protein
MKVFVVHRTGSGYTREDNSTSEVVGVYTEATLAKKVALLARGTWTEIDLDYIWPGIEQAAPEFGITL